MPATRQAAFAGRFYPATRQECARMLEAMAQPVEVKGTVLGAVVPHAGWVYSGPTAALSMAGLSAAQPDTLVLFGAVHTFDRNHASLYAEGVWETPLGQLPVDDELASRVARCRHVTVDAAAHRNEHSIEVQLPLIQHALGQVSILPIGVRPGELAADVGRSVAAEVLAAGRRAVFLASTDLTHYGPAFGFEPHGRGEDGIRWAKDVNDRRFVDLVAAMEADAIVPEAEGNHNACGAGAVAAALAAVREAGADSYVELQHTTSAERELAEGGHPVNSVGYEAGLFTRSS